MGTILLVIIYLTSGPTGANMVVTQFTVSKQRFSHAKATRKNKRIDFRVKAPASN
jgi:hypothetical protein